VDVANGLAHGRAAHIERIVFSHLTHELSADPGSDLRAALLIEPTEPVHRPDDPSALTLLRQHISETCIICCAPESEVEQEEALAQRVWQGEEEDDLGREETEVEEVNVRFWVGGVEEGREYIVCRRDAENCKREARHVLARKRKGSG